MLILGTFPKFPSGVETTLRKLHFVSFARKQKKSFIMSISSSLGEKAQSIVIHWVMHHFFDILLHIKSKDNLKCLELNSLVWL